MESIQRKVVIASPLLIIAANFGAAFVFGGVMGKWAFLPMILIGWALWLFFIAKFGGASSTRKWLQKPTGALGWNVFAVVVGLIPLPLFLFHADTLASWQIWVPWIVLALINPWVEEFYWRGLLLDATEHWTGWVAVLYTSLAFSLNHAAFGINSELNSGFEIIGSTFLMGVVWAIVYKKTKSLRWTIVAHFLVDFLGLSVPAFLDLWQKGTW
ncbi:CPBP family intramembrane glutamic endopeptidase [Sabulibacter ruber]|uniref:CPBP family intramembrane glutamic endopeptidase n=1 Tax=Sabulibacter ruber TaxID=2811901 RepID=UPI001A961B39|nr:CPBP family intramembrane glutamic endopeptidase [Sabulibacter ruber]